MHGVLVKRSMPPARQVDQPQGTNANSRIGTWMFQNFSKSLSRRAGCDYNGSLLQCQAAHTNLPNGARDEGESSRNVQSKRLSDSIKR